jgi:adenine deaminase
MLAAFERMKELGGGMALAENNQIIHGIPLPLNGMMSDLDMGLLIQHEKKMIGLLKERGFKHSDLSFATLFLSATHLPYIRLTPMGLYDVKNRQVLVPPSKRANVQIG